MRHRLRSSAEWLFFGALWQAAPNATVLWWALVVLRGLLPAAFALAMGALVGDVQASASLTSGLIAVGAVFIAMQALGPVHDAVSATLGAPHVELAPRPPARGLRRARRAGAPRRS